MEKKSYMNRLIDNNIGPGAYTPKPLESGPSHEFGIKRGYRVDTSPGPGAYEPSHKYSKSKSPSVRISKT